MILSKTEEGVIKRYCRGQTEPQIARETFRAKSTVHRHIHNVCLRHEITNGRQLTVAYIQHTLLLRNILTINIQELLQ